jgi:hypothetical protein
MYKAIHGLAPDYICNKILFYYEVTGRNLRSFDNMHLYKPVPHKDVFKTSLDYHGATVWNELPWNGKSATSLPIFKRMCKTLSCVN